MLKFEDKNVIVDYEIGFHRDNIVPLEIDCALQGYFYCKECEAYTAHNGDTCYVCKELKEEEKDIW